MTITYKYSVLIHSCNPKLKSATPCKRDILILFVLFAICISPSSSFQLNDKLGNSRTRRQGHRKTRTARVSSSLLSTADSKSPSSDLYSNLQDKFNYNGRITAPDPNFRCGFVSLIGAPNMGKSTLLNALLEETLCTATHRPQTTRHAILGVLTSLEQKVQICFKDTPGVIGDPAYRLQEGMMEAVQGAFRDSDVILVITDMFSTPIEDDTLFEKLQKTNKKKIVVINKIDLADKVSGDSNTNTDADVRDETSIVKDVEQDNDVFSYEKTLTVQDAVSRWRELIPDAIAIIPMTASNGPQDVGVVALRKLLMGGPDVPAAFRDLGRPLEGMFLPGVKFVEDEVAHGIIPKSPPLYDSDTLTDRTERFFASEIIRGTLFTKLGKELPYCCEVQIDEFREPKPGDKNPVTRITATVCVERDSQKGIVVGKGGVKIKEIGMEAREKLEEFLQTKVFLNLEVKVEKNWRRDEKKLKALGYLK
mmetsp:Transcript_6240/g.11789  ORF Transcript_6240/g.11789 Transcript_6240/m.11789 type:complete len:478 (+) Transcript_6240:19-1452(+)